MAAKRPWRRLAENSGPPVRQGDGARASLDKRAWRPHAKRANSLAGEDIDESNCFWPAGPRPARRSSLRGGRSRLRRWSLSRRMRWTPWRGRWPSAIRLPRRRRGAPCLWRALLLAGRRARLPLNGGRASRDAGCGVVRDRRARATYFRRAQRSHYGRAADVLICRRFKRRRPCSLLRLVRRVIGAADGLAGRVDPRDSRLHGQRAS
jgi:hypothetical protein